MEQTLNRLSAIQKRALHLLSAPPFFVPHRPDRPQAKIACAYFGLTFDHAMSVIFLFSNERHSAGYALIRSVFETYFRGNWVKQQPNLEVSKGPFPIKFPNIKTLVKTPESRTSVCYPEGEHASFLYKEYRHLSEYTHSGIGMLRVHLSQVGEVPPPDPEEIERILRIPVRLHLSAAIQWLDCVRCSDDAHCQGLENEHDKCPQFRATLGEIGVLIESLR